MVHHNQSVTVNLSTFLYSVSYYGLLSMLAGKYEYKLAENKYLITIVVRYS